MGVDSFPLVDILSHVLVVDDEVRFQILETINFGERCCVINHHPKEYVEDDGVGVVIRESEAGCDQEYPGPHHRGDRLNDSLDEAHVGADFFLVVNTYCEGVKVHFHIEKQQSKEVD